MLAAQDVEARFDDFVNRIAACLGHADRHEPFRAYTQGLILPGERKSVEPMAARLDPAHVPKRHQSMHHFVSQSDWSDSDVLDLVRSEALGAMRAHGRLEGWIVDDTGFPKKGKHSVGVANQYCGVLGKNANCQCVVSVSLANTAASVPAAFRLYLPESWASDESRRAAVGVPEKLTFMTKWEIAIEQVDVLLAKDVAKAPVLADAGFGNIVGFRDALTVRGLTYTVGVAKGTTIYIPTVHVSPRGGRDAGRAGILAQMTDDPGPISLLDLAQALPEDDWYTVEWREGTKGPMRSTFAALRVRPAHRDKGRTEPRAEQWALIEWPEGEGEPSRYWLSTQPASIDVADLVYEAKLRWRIERDYQELKDEIGIDHYEGRNWRGLHHHITLCVVAYGFLLAERARLSPPGPRAIFGIKEPAISIRVAGRGTAPAS